MRVSDLQSKDVISLINGKKLGRIIDIEITGSEIKYFVIEPRKFFRFFAPKEEVNVYINQIKKIGEDVILVEI